MATLQQQRRDLMRKAEQFQNQARRQLEQIVKTGRGNGRMMDPFGASQSTNSAFLGGGTGQNSAATNWRFGQTITDADVKRFIESGGGNPYTGALQQLNSLAKERGGKTRSLGRTGSDVVKAANANAQSALQQLFADAQAKEAEANYWNQYRYDYGLGNLENLRNRNQDRVQNYGKAAKADLEEQFAQNLANVTSSLSDRGLGNSTILDAFNAKNARDLAREQQRLSEMVDDRASRYDTADTANAVSFAERRNDVAPDMGQLLQLAQMYGASGGVDGVAGAPAASSLGAMAGGGSNREQAQAIPLQYGMNLPYATSAWNAGRIQGNVSGAYPSLQHMMGPGGGLVDMPQATGSNAYPVVHSQASSTPTAQQAAADAAMQQRIRSRQSAYNQSPYAQHRAQRLAMQEAGLYGQPIKPIDHLNGMYGMKLTRKRMRSGDSPYQAMAYPLPFSKFDESLERAGKSIHGFGSSKIGMLW